MRSSTLAAAAAALAAILAAAAPASAATLSVDDDRGDCPAALYTSVQAAVDAAAPGDTVTVCPGAYAEGSGVAGSSALTITKSLTLKGAGADLVSITPVSSGPASGRLLEASPDLRNGLGDVLAVVGTPTRPIAVDVSGITVDGYDPAGRPVAVEAGVVYVDAEGSIARSRVTNVVTSEGDNAYLDVGGWRGAQPGVGIAQTTNALLAPSDGTRTLRIDRTRVDKYNRVGVLIDAAQNDAPPYVRSGVVNAGDVRFSQVIGRTECVNYAGTGDCATVGLLTTGPLFGQDGVRVTAGGRVKIAGSTISQNLVNGTGAPVRSTLDATGVETPSSANNANLALGAGVRLAGASLSSFSDAGGQVITSSISSSNVVDNAYGALNLTADGTTAATGDPDATTGIGDVLKAEGNWWGLNYYRATNPGPAISPATNPTVPENPVSGAPTGPAGAVTSDSVDFFPYRSGSQVDPTNGELPVADAPLPVDDAAPAVQLAAGPAAAPRGSSVVLDAAASDDFGVKRVRFSAGAVTLGSAGAPPYRLAVTLPADAACDSTVTYTATVTDSLGQTAASTVGVKATCAGPTDPGGGTPTPPAAPSLSVSAFGEVLSGPTVLTIVPNAPARVARIDVLLGSRTVCVLTGPPYRCRVSPTGADVGTQALRVVLTDATGATAQAGASVRVPAFRTAVKATVRTTALKGGKARRTITAALVLPDGVTKAQGCRSGAITVVVKRNGRPVANQQLRLSRNCTVTKAITAPRAKQPFTLSARFGGNAVLRAASTSRRFT